MAQKRVVAAAFFLASVLFFVVALLPLGGGRGPNAAFLALGVVFLIIGGAQARGTRPRRD